MDVVERVSILERMGREKETVKMTNHMHSKQDRLVVNKLVTVMVVMKAVLVE